MFQHVPLFLILEETYPQMFNTSHGQGNKNNSDESRVPISLYACASITNAGPPMRMQGWESVWKGGLQKIDKKNHSLADKAIN